MTVETSGKTLEKFTKIRSLDEIITRGGQAISVYREQRRGGGQIPSDEEFVRLIDLEQFGKAPVIAETLWQKFYAGGDERFFSSFRDQKASAAVFKAKFGTAAVNRIVESAEKIAGGRIDLLGLRNLYVGTDIDWHREPLSAKRSPLKHWKDFDELDISETGNKKVVWELNRHQHFFTLGAAFWLSGDERFAAIFCDQIESWMEQNPPGLGLNWSSSLEVAFRAMSWIWAFHFFRHSDNFRPELFKKAVKYLYSHGRHIEQYLSKYYSPNTHLTGEALGLYYLGTQLPFLDRAKHWRKHGEDILFAEIKKQVYPDGVYFEQSTWYQRYTADIYSHFVVLRSLFSGVNYSGGSAAVENGLEAAFDFMMHLTQPDGRTPIIGDDDGGRMLPLTSAEPDDFRGTLAIGAVLFNRGDQKFVSERASEEIFWLLGTNGVALYDAIEGFEPVQTSVDFPDGGYAVMRDGWTDTDNYLIVDCGEVGSLSGGHGHADALAIEMSMHGRVMLVDSGTYTYHESRELRDHFRSTTAHNTLSVDGLSSSIPGNPFSWKTKAQAHRNAWIAEGRFDFFEGTHNGYERLQVPATHTRSILFLKGDYWIMRDFVETSGSHKYTLNFHYDSDCRPEIGGGGEWVGDRDHRLYTFGDNGSWQRKESWISNNHGNRINAPFVRYISNGVGIQEFFTFMLPVHHGAAPPAVTEIETASGRAFVIKYALFTDVFVYNDTTGQAMNNGIFASNFVYSWARLSDGEAVPDELVLIDGNSLNFGGKEIFESHELTYAAIRRLGSQLYIKTDLGRSVRPL